VKYWDDISQVVAMKNLSASSFQTVALFIAKFNDTLQFFGTSDTTLFKRIVVSDVV